MERMENGFSSNLHNDILYVLYSSSAHDGFLYPVDSATELLLQALRTPATCLLSENTDIAWVGKSK